MPAQGCNECCKAFHAPNSLVLLIARNGDLILVFLNRVFLRENCPCGSKKSVALKKLISFATGLDVRKMSID